LLEDFVFLTSRKDASMTDTTVRIETIPIPPAVQQKVTGAFREIADCGSLTRFLVSPRDFPTHNGLMSILNTPSAHQRFKHLQIAAAISLEAPPL
jgi:hypothetical protein